MFTLRILGSGDAFNAAGSLHSCYMLENPNGALMLECGPSVLAGMKRDGVPTERPDVVLVSHLHGDHFGGIPFLLLEYIFANVRERPLIIAGPPGTESRVHRLHTELYKESICRTLPFDLSFQVLNGGDTTSLAGFDVEAFEVPHSDELVCLGYKLSRGDTSMVFSGDSAWTDDFVTKSAGADLFLCECCSMEAGTPIHVSYREILASRRALTCKRLLLTHVGADVRDAEGPRRGAGPRRHGCRSRCSRRRLTL